jgi:hypothetical protein
MLVFRMRGPTLLVSMLFLCSWVTLAHAQASDPAAAEALFREGRAAAQANNYELACKKFHESHRLDPAPGTVLNIADCEEKLGHIATAWTLYQEVTQKIPERDERHAIAKERVAALEPRVPKLAIRLAPDAPADARVSRDGVELKSASLDTPLPVDPGKHEIVVEAEGRARSRVEISIAEGEVKRVNVSAGAPLPVSDRGGKTTKVSSGGKTTGYVLAGVGVVGIGIGAVTGMMVLSKKKTVDDNCNAQKQCNQTGADAAESGKTLGTVSGVSFIVGAVALGAGMYLVLSSKEKQSTEVGVGPGQLYLRRSF